jgi:hypothetical protein
MELTQRVPLATSMARISLQHHGSPRWQVLGIATDCPPPTAWHWRCDGRHRGATHMRTVSRRSRPFAPTLSGLAIALTLGACGSSSGPGGSGGSGGHSAGQTTFISAPFTGQNSVPAARRRVLDRRCGVTQHRARGRSVSAKPAALAGAAAAEP